MSNSKKITPRFDDGCGLDEKLKYSGLYTDLCGMSVEDYIKAGKHCCCNNNGNNDNNNEGEGDIVNPSNEILVYTTKNIYKFNELNNINNLVVSDLEKYVVENSGTEISFVKTADEIDVNLNELSDEEYEAWRSENSYIPLLIIDTNSNIEIYEKSDNKTNEFSVVGTILINNKTHNVLAKVAKSEEDQYLTFDGINFCTYSADGEINIEYTIK